MGDFTQDRWINGHGVVGGHEAYVRKNVSLQATRKADYPNMLMVSLIYKQQGESGLPSSEEELQRLDNYEETIADRLCSRHGGLYALCVTGGGTRDLFLFLPGRPTEQQIAAEFDASLPAVDYDFGLRHDPAWRPYVTMLPDAADGAPASARQPWWKRLLGS
jgi:hypothetical protein